MKGKKQEGVGSSNESPGKSEKQRLTNDQSGKSGWSGTWERPVKVDESSYDPLTIARMTDHNVRGRDKKSED
jgi:hypothetical protein